MQTNASSSPPPEQQQQSRSPSGRRKYKGVRRRKWGRWVVEIRLPNSRVRIWLGSYDTPEKAARAFDAAFVCLRGPGGTDGLNFPGSPPAVCRTSDAQEVYEAAVSHANRAANAAEPAPEAATTETTTANDGAPVESVATVPAVLQVSRISFDWSQLVANPPPLFSPTVVGSHAYQLISPTAPPADDLEENDDCACPGLWSFDSGGSCSRH